MNPCKLKEPKVIDNALLEKTAKEQGPKGEAGRLAELEGIPLEDIKEIRLEFMSIVNNILKIDHLWVLTSLTKLNLNNNFIEKIENLEALTFLVNLNLSFNKISKIENLEKLTNLETLSLYDNKITVMENMDTLTKLSVFSIGNNNIGDLANILYLRQFPNLKSLNLEGNPCAKIKDFRFYIAVFLPQLVYYEYKLIYDLEREIGNEYFGSQLRSLLEKEEKEMEILRAEKQEKADAELHALSFVEYLNSRHLFDALFENDSDGKNLLKMGEEAKEFYDEFEEQFIALCKQIFDNGQQQYVIRKEELDQFLKSVEEAKKQNQEESIKHMELFLEQKSDIFLKIKKLQNMLDINDITYDEFMDKCDGFVSIYDDILHTVWKALMKLELELYEQMEDVNQSLEHGMTELVNQFIESSQAFFTQIRELEVTYSENIGECAQRYHTNANLNDDFVIPDALKEMMSDKEILHNALATSHDMHMQIIDAREDTLTSRAKEWLNNLVDTLVKDEIKRNRGKILEINHFLDIQKEEFEDLNAEYTADADEEPEP